MNVKCFNRAALIAVTGFGGLAIASPAHAGLFEFLFGGSPSPSYAPAPVYSPDPLGVRVNPRRQHRPRSVSARATRAPVLAKPIDPVTHPNWFMEDPTLRRGDIVVLKGQVLVFNGGRGRSVEEFTALSKSKLISKRERERIGKMAETRGGSEPVAERGNQQVSLASP